MCNMTVVVHNVVVHCAHATVIVYVFMILFVFGFQGEVRHSLSYTECNYYCYGVRLLLTLLMSFDVDLLRIASIQQARLIVRVFVCVCVCVHVIIAVAAMAAVMVVVPVLLCVVFLCKNSLTSTVEKFNCDETQQLRNSKKKKKKKKKKYSALI
eukprot:Lankesteria_metandrocarpae@DN3569_c0_g1_i1.p1